jgi:hypothetical protein
MEQVRRVSRLFPAFAACVDDLALLHGNDLADQRMAGRYLMNTGFLPIPLPQRLGELCARCETIISRRLVLPDRRPAYNQKGTSLLVSSGHASGD